MRQKRRQFLRNTGIGAGVIGGIALPNVATVAAGSSSEYNWTETDHDTGYTVKSGTKEERYEMGTTLGYKNTIRPDGKDYVIHEFRVDVATGSKEKYYNRSGGWSDSYLIKGHNTASDVTKNSDSEVIAN